MIHRKPSLLIPAAARGALAGLIILSFASTALIGLSALEVEHNQHWVMLLGPNIGVVLGGVLGAIYRLVIPVKIPQRYTRIGSEKGIMLVVRSKRQEEVKNIMDILNQVGVEKLEVV